MYRRTWVLVALILAVLGVGAAIWGAVHIRSLEGVELAVYTQTEYSEMEGKYLRAREEYDEAARQLSGYMTNMETLSGELSTARRQLETAQSELTYVQTQLSDARNQLEEETQRRETAQAELLEARRQLQGALRRVQGLKDSLAREEAEARDALDVSRAEMEEKDARIAALQAEAAQTEQALAAAEAALARMRRFESASMPLSFDLSEDYGAAEVGGWIYISCRDGWAQGALRPIEAEESVGREEAVAYLLSLAPGEGLPPAVYQMDFPGGTASRFAREYVDEDGATAYGEFCVLEIDGRLFCLETQSTRSMADASGLMDGLMEGMSGR